MEKEVLIDIADFLTSVTGFKICKTKSEVRRLLKQGGLSFNKERLDPNTKFILLTLDEKGKITSLKRVIEK
jgi:tyrosyl-tRNA synthetase